jgi:hypothetical protein
MKHKIIDNFLEKNTFLSIQSLVLSNSFPYYFNSKINNEYDGTESCFYMTHMIHNGVAPSSHYKPFIPLLETIKVKSLLRVKVNLYPRTEKIEVHKPHKDYPFKHKGCILYFNTCNGFTILKNGTKIKSIANRALFFDASIDHSSTSCTDQKARFNVNINYF